MITMFKKFILVSLLCIVISCAFSTRGGQSSAHTFRITPTEKKFRVSQDTIIKYVERPPLTKEQKAKRDSTMRKYIGSIIQPYTDDLKQESKLNTTNLTKFIQSQGNRLDSINTLRYLEAHQYQTASTQRDSFLIQSIIKDRRIDSLQSSLIRIEKTNVDATQIVNGINDLTYLVRDLAMWGLITLAAVFIGLTLFLEWIRSKKRKELKLIKQDE